MWLWRADKYCMHSYFFCIYFLALLCDHGSPHLYGGPLRFILITVSQRRVASWESNLGLYSSLRPATVLTTYSFPSPDWQSRRSPAQSCRWWATRQCLWWCRCRYRRSARSYRVNTVYEVKSKWYRKVLILKKIVSHRSFMLSECWVHARQGKIYETSIIPGIPKGQRVTFLNVVCTTVYYTFTIVKL